MSEKEEGVKGGFFSMNKKLQDILGTIIMMSTIISIFGTLGVKFIGDKLVIRVDKALTLSETRTNATMSKLEDRVVVLEMDNAQAKVHNILKQAKKINAKSNDIKFGDIEKAIRDYSTINLNLFNSREQTDIRIAYDKVIKYYENNSYNYD